MSTEQRPVSDMETLRRATEGRDAATLLSLYSDDAELRIIDRLHPPSQPLELQGKEAIRSYLEDICGREMTHTIETPVVAPDRWAYTQACQYPNGTRVVMMATVDLRDGKIARQTNVQAWDE